jgi:hypothetical protein
MHRNVNAVWFTTFPNAYGTAQRLRTLEQPTSAATSCDKQIHLSTTSMAYEAKSG